MEQIRKFGEQTSRILEFKGLKASNIYSQLELKDQWHKKTRETAMRALDKLENFRQKILGNCNGKINSSFLSSIFNGQDVHIYKYVSATFQNDAKSRK
jgi:hypothetical protein